MAGPKYYQIDTGAEDDEGNRVMIDTRPFQPFSSYLFFQQLGKQLMSDHELPNRMSAAEIVEGSIGVRRYTNMPIFSVPYVAQAFERGDLEGFRAMFAQMAGDIPRQFMVPGRFVNEIMGGVGEKIHEWDPDGTLGGLGEKVSEDALAMKDSMEDEFMGRVVSDIPFVKSVLPNRINPFTGEHFRTKGPIWRQISAQSEQDSTPWERTLGNVNVSSFDMVGKWNSRTATGAISLEIGRMLMAKGQSGETLGQRLSARVKTLDNLPIELRKQHVNELNKALRDAATIKASRTYPKLFRKELTLKAAQPVLKKSIKGLLDSQ